MIPNWIAWRALILSQAAPIRKQPLTVTVTAHENERLNVEWALASGRALLLFQASILPHANSRGLNEEILLAQLGRLGSTPYEIGESHGSTSPALRSRKRRC